MNRPVSDKFTVSPIHMFFLIYVSLVGIGMMSFQHDIVSIAGSDAWMATLLSLLVVFVLIWMMFRILEVQRPGEEHLAAINRRYFGKFLGMTLNIVFALYFVMGAFYAFRFYLEVIQVWIFPLMNLWPISLLILALAYYMVTGGFQTVAAICFWGAVFMLIFVVSQVVMVFPYLHGRNLLPVYVHQTSELIQASRTMSQQFLGCEMLLVFYPYIQSREKSRKWAYWAVAHSGFVYLLVLFISLTYFTPNQMEELLWPTLSIISMIELPLMQRTEYMVLTLWLVKLLANIGLAIWASCQLLKKDMNIKPRVGLGWIMGIFIALMFLVTKPNQLKLMSVLYNHIGEYLVFLFIPLLFILSQALRIWKPGNKKSTADDPST
ncbi:GerAB/ArcD/ProY family transporter [Paenibacillus physcomitrellae]|uniref:Germination protein GerB n=1 Tax=Paenibacillus physcomitrellae TaxID=1619311 RepID=A0ABQ1FQW6_9BACL|nr:GerAB/ArcD/ProY family transporter [Paenibacillus physcomitrellae]GGA25511.1 germination protein GerB [Paenibacillus physcomitrellae]